jgi:hypothetical protein
VICGSVKTATRSVPPVTWASCRLELASGRLWPGWAAASSITNTTRRAPAREDASRSEEVISEEWSLCTGARIATIGCTRYRSR